MTVSGQIGFAGHTTQQLASLLTNEDRTAALEKVYVLAKFEVLQVFHLICQYAIPIW